MTVLGSNVKGSGAYTSADNGRKYGSKFTAVEAGTINEMHCWTRPSAGAGQITLSAYADSSGAPGALIGCTTIQQMATTVDLEIVVTGLAWAFSAGPIWLCWATEKGTADGGQSGIFETDSSGEHQGKITGAAYNPQSNPFGTIDTSGPRKFAIWAVYSTTPPVSPPVASVAPVVTGSLQQGGTLTVTTPGVYTGDAIDTRTYQWQRDGANISGATGATYVTQAADIGKAIRAVETATNAGGSASQNSNAISVVVNPWTDTIIPAKYMRGRQINPAVYTSERLDARGTARQVSASSAILLTAAKERLDASLT